jgi:hypothetical protein
MMWQVQYRRGAASGIAWLCGRDDAVRKARRLLDEGCEVLSLGTDALPRLLDRHAIERLCMGVPGAKVGTAGF